MTPIPFVLACSDGNPPGEAPSLTDLTHAVERVSSGEAAAFEQIVDATSDRMVRLSARILGSVADAEDVVQEAYVKAYQAIMAGKFDRRARPETWLHRIVTNASIDALRHRARRPDGSDQLLETQLSVDGAASAETRLALAELSDWLSHLPTDQRIATTLKAMEGMTSAEVAQVMQCSEGAVEQLLVRARATLRQLSTDPQKLTGRSAPHVWKKNVG
ncbi:RNA polymerase sigma factor [Myxococcota bacterium]